MFVMQQSHTGARTVIGQTIFSFSSIITSSFPGGLTQSFQTRGFNYHVSDGQVFSLLFDTDASTTGFASLWVGYGDLNPTTGTLANVYSTGYSGGSASVILNDDGISRPSPFDVDLNFVTHVDTSTSAVPEPASWALMIFGLAAIGGRLRNRRWERALAVH